VSLRTTSRPRSGCPTITATSASRSDSEKLRGTGTSCTVSAGCLRRRRRTAARGTPPQTLSSRRSAPSLPAAHPPPELRLRLQHLRLDPLQPPRQRRPRLGRRAALALPEEELRPETRLERTDPPAESRLAQPEPLRRPEHLSAARHPEEQSRIVPGGPSATTSRPARSASTCRARCPRGCRCRPMLRQTRRDQ
jgi:hypothetical protein